MRIINFKILLKKIFVYDFCHVLNLISYLILHSITYLTILLKD